jgi:hypothetical protein
MDLKNALAVCLISLFSATLVVLIARALDSQAASRLEPQLAAIVEELQAIRKQGGGFASAGTAAKTAELGDGLMVYYFHGNVRCPTCRAIESQAKEIVDSRFADQLKSGAVAWKILNFEKGPGADLAKQFKVGVPVVVLARMRDGKVQDWKRLDEVWALVNDKPAYAKFISEEVDRMLAGAPQPPPKDEAPDETPPEPASKTTPGGELPLPTDPPELPLP